MKTATLKRLWRAFGQPYSSPRSCGAMATAALLLTASSLAAMPTVTTVSGGPSQNNPQFFGYVDGDTAAVAQFHTPFGIALDSTGNFLYVADRDNNAIRRLDFSAGQTITFATSSIQKPVGVAVDGSGNVYVLNRGNGVNGTVVEFDRFGDLLLTNSVWMPLINAAGIALDGSANIYVSLNNALIRIVGTNITTLATNFVAGTSLQGIAVMDDGRIAACDSGRNGILLINPVNGTVTTNTGFNGTGDHFGTKSFAKFNQPFGVAKAGGGVLVVTDYGNNRAKVVDSFGTVTNLYGVSSNFWYTGSSAGVFPGWFDGTVCAVDEVGCPEARLPVGVTVAADGAVYTTEVFYHLIRHTTGAGLIGPAGGGGGGGGGATNVIAPTISPNSGYYPMGQTITVASPNPTVFYTTDGSDPTTNSLQLTMNGNVGSIRWFNSTNDLTALRVKAFIGTNASVAVGGQSVNVNNIGTPPDVNTNIYGGVGSTIVVPVVVNLRTNDQVKSYQFNVEITPNDTNTPMIPAQFQALNIRSNDFIRLATAAQGNSPATNSFLPYLNGSTRGLQVTAIGTGANVFFQHFAVVALLEVPIPGNASEGQTYSLKVTFPSATSDGSQTPVSLTPMPSATILITNVAYTVGDSSPGGWYNAGGFGNDNLDNADVNNAFYASLGLRVPYTFSDAFDAMDAYPEDGPGFVGGDGLIRFLDLEVILERSLRADTNNWKRAWSSGGDKTNAFTTLSSGSPDLQGQIFSVVTPPVWYRQALVGAGSVGSVLPGSTVDVPVYVKLANGVTVSGMEFRALVNAEGNAPALSQAAQFVPAAGISNTMTTALSIGDGVGCGWQLGTFSFASRSSNYLGTVRFTIPASAQAGQVYTLSFTNADGAPDLHTQYDFETRRASVAVSAAAVPPSICADEWKLHFFGSLTNPLADDLADADGDGVPNWLEYLAGTDPTNPGSKLQFTQTDKQVVGGQTQLALHWLTAPGKAYEVQWSSKLVGGSWNVLGTVSGDGSVASFPDTNVTGAARFYRLRVLP